jgi:acetyl esterase
VPPAGLRGSGRAGLPFPAVAMDPETKAVMDLLDAAYPCIEEHGAPVVRDALALVPRPEPPDIHHVEDRLIPGPGGDVPVRLYRPREGVCPGIVYFHGGGWCIGDVDLYDWTCRALANGTGAVVASVDYRLAPEHAFPAAAEDCYAAAAWMHAEADVLAVDGRRLAVGGDSAGGNLAAVVSLMARDREGPPLQFQLLVYPVINHSFDTDSYRENATGYFLTRANMEWYWRSYLGDDGDGTNPYASPLQASDLRGLPPALVITAEYDPLRDEGEAYGRRLQEAGVPTTISRYDGLFHGFFSLGALLPAARQAASEAEAALRGALAE